ncbi:MAG: tagaturonate reductase [Firmicutes bacterium]|nr:tagaturonate reductase [Bacillota bacterium]
MDSTQGGDAAVRTDAQRTWSPIRIVQIGEGNFLRGFFDWMIEACRARGVYDGRIAVTQPRPGGAVRLQELRLQNGIYTVVTRGLQDGREVERVETIDVFGKILDPYSQWADFLRLAEDPDVEVVVSNTTEAGLAYEPTDASAAVCPPSFAARLTHFLHRRCLHVQGDPQRGITCFPCELVERNGDALRDAVLRHCADWCLPEGVVEWIGQANRFVNSLVDRIVTGYPVGQEALWKARLGHDDPLLTVVEPYYLWVIEMSADAFDRILPLRQAGLNVQLVDDLTPYHLRKVRMLNGAHTLLTSIGLQRGIETVRAAMTDLAVSHCVRRAIYDEIIPMIGDAGGDLAVYAETLWERFANPYVEHRLQDIALNHSHKFCVRLLPTALAYRDQMGVWPPVILRAWAEWLGWYMGGEKAVDQQVTRSVRDDPYVVDTLSRGWIAWQHGERSLCEMVQDWVSDPRLWGRELPCGQELAEALASHLTTMVGVRA